MEDRHISRERKRKDHPNGGGSGMKVKRGSESLSEVSSEWLLFHMEGNKIVKYSLIHTNIFIECLLCASIMIGCCLF